MATSWYLLENNAKSTLNGAVLAAAATITVNDASGFPATGDFFVTVWDGATYFDPGDDAGGGTGGGMEVMLVTGVAGNVLTVTRAQLGTADVGHADTNDVRLLIVDALIEQITGAITAHDHSAAGDGATVSHGDLGDLHQDVTTTGAPQFARIGVGVAADATAVFRGVDDTESVQHGFEFTREITDATDSRITIHGKMTADATGDNIEGHYAMEFAAYTKDTCGFDFGLLYGIQGYVYHEGSGTLASGIGAKTGVRLHGDGDITHAYGLVINPGLSAGSTGSIITNIGVSIVDPLLDGAGTITNNYALYIPNQTAGTNNWAIYLAGSGVDNGIHMGGDVVFHRSGANEATLPDKLIVGLELEMDGDLNHDGSNVGFYGTAPIAQAVLATGGGATVDNVITALQNLGLVKQA